DPDFLSVVERAQVQLARRGLVLGPVRAPVDHDAAAAADTLATVVIERDRLLSLRQQRFVQDVEQLEKGAVRRRVRDLVTDKSTRGWGARLTPDVEDELHL